VRTEVKKTGVLLMTAKVLSMLVYILSLAEISISLGSTTSVHLAETLSVLQSQPQTLRSHDIVSAKAVQ
jgi:hypothetical protein